MSIHRITDTSDFSPKLITAPPNLMENQGAIESSQKQQQITSDLTEATKKQDKPKRTKKKTSTKLIFFDSASESSDEDSKSDQAEESDRTDAKENTEPRIDAIASETNAHEAAADEIPEATGASLEAGEDTAYNEYDETRAENRIKGTSGITSSALMQPLANGYVPLDDLWDKPWFDMKASSQSAGKGVKLTTVISIFKERTPH